MPASPASRRFMLIACLLVPYLTVPTAPAAEKARPFVPDNYPDKIAPVNWPGNPGTRYEMVDLVQKFPREDIAIKVSVEGWTEELYKKDDLGTYGVATDAQREALTAAEGFLARSIG